MARPCSDNVIFQRRGVLRGGAHHDGASVACGGWKRWHVVPTHQLRVGIRSCNIFSLMVFTSLMLVQGPKDIVTWINKMIGPAINNIMTIDEVEKILNSESKVVLWYLNSLVGSESDELTSASRLEDDVNFYQTVNPDLAKLFQIDLKVKRPALVLLKKELENLSLYGLFLCSVSQL